MERAWNIFKIIFSSLLVILACWMFYAFNISGKFPFSPLNIGIPAVLVFFAAIPWVAANPHKNYRAAGLMGIVFSIGVSSMTVAGFKNEIEFPMSCSPRSQIGCNFINWLYGNYGSNAVGTFLLLFTLFMVAASIKIIWKKP